MDNQFKRAHSFHYPKDYEFRTPEQVAAQDVDKTGTPIISQHEVMKNKEKKWKKWKIPKLWPPNKWTYICLAILLIILAGAGYGSYVVFHKTKPKAAIALVKPKVEVPTTVASSLSGLQVSPATNQLPITAVMVENSVDARPQSGLGEAGVVFEALAEGGITRYVALYQSDASTSIGPVRSARPYFISWILGFDADYAHVGGSPEALADIASWGVKDLDEFSNGNYYQRVSSRESPHNVYTTPAELFQLEQSKGYTTSTFTSWPRKVASPLKTPTATTISLAMASSDYNPSYTYNPKTNMYGRDNGGSPDIDTDTNQQISVPVVVAMVIDESNGPLDGIGAYYSEYQTTGSGTAYIFQDGGVSIGQWTKSSDNSQIMFTNSANQPLPLDPGEVWITAVTSDSNVTYQ